MAFMLMRVNSDHSRDILDIWFDLEDINNKIEKHIVESDVCIVTDLFAGNVRFFSLMRSE